MCVCVCGLDLVGSGKSPLSGSFQRENENEANFGFHTMKGFLPASCNNQQLQVVVYNNNTKRSFTHEHQS